jgi:hypothetical protein
LEQAGISADILTGALQHTYDVLDAVDNALIEKNEPRLAETIELANLSAVVGNLLRSGVARGSNGLFTNNGPHKFPDLLNTRDPKRNVEIKVALEDNNPKGHLAKAGFHLICRYVLGQADGGYDRTTRGNVVWVWELRAGYLRMRHFNTSNTTGDSGKTAVVNAAGLRALEPVYCALPFCPMPPKGRRYRDLLQLFPNAFDPPPRAR